MRFRGKILLFNTIFILSIFSLFIPNSFSKNLNEDEQFIRVGIGAYKDGFLDISEKQFSTFIKEFPNHPKIYEAYYLLGKSLLFKGKLKEAESAFLKILNEGKNLDYIEYCFFWLGYINSKLGNAKEARKNLLILIKNFPKFDLSDYAHYLLGIANLRLNRVIQAINSFKYIIQLSTRKEFTVYSYFWLGMASFRQGDFNSSVFYFEKVLENEKSISENYLKQAIFWLGEAQLKLENFIEAKTNFKSFIERFLNDPILSEIYLKIGYCEFRLNHYGEASKIFQNFQERYKDSPSVIYARYLIGRILNSIEDYVASNKEMNFILDRTDDINLRALSLLILFWNYINLGQIEESNRIFQRIQKTIYSEDLKNFSRWVSAESMFYGGRVSDSIPYYFNLLNSKFREMALYRIAKGYFFENNFRDALTNLDILLLEFPNSNYFDEALFIKGECLFKLGSYDQALDVFKSLLEIKGNITWALFALTRIGMIYQLKDENKASEIFLKIISEYPDHPLSSHAAVQLGNFFFKKKNLSNAILYFTLVLKGSLKELFGHAYFAIGEIFYSQGRYEKAKKSFEDALKYSKTDSLLYFLIHLEIGNLHKMWGNYKDAKKSYEIILNKSKDDEIKRAAKELLTNI